MCWEPLLSGKPLVSRSTLTSNALSPKKYDPEPTRLKSSSKEELLSMWIPLARALTEREKALGRTQVNHCRAVVHTRGTKQLYWTCIKGWTYQAKPCQTDICNVTTTGHISSQGRVVVIYRPQHATSTQQAYFLYTPLNIRRSILPAQCLHKTRTPCPKCKNPYQLPRYCDITYFLPPVYSRYNPLTLSCRHLSPLLTETFPFCS